MAADCLAQSPILKAFARHSAALTHYQFALAPAELLLRRLQLWKSALPDIGLEPASQYPWLPAVRRVCSARLNARRWLLREIFQLARSRPERLDQNEPVQRENPPPRFAFVNEWRRNQKPGM